MSVYFNPDTTPENTGLTILHVVDIKACNINQRIIKSAGEQMLRRDLRMLPSGLEVNSLCWHLFM